MQDHTPNPIPRKQCTKCLQWLPATSAYFRRDKKAKDGFGHRCKKCRSGRDDYRFAVPVRDGYKRCPKCTTDKPATTEYFARSSRKKDGLETYCKGCERDYRIANRDKRIAKGREYYRTNKARIAEERRKNSAARKEYMQEYRERNKERIRQKRHEYNERNKVQISEKESQWRIDNKEHVAERYRVWAEKNREKIREQSRASAARHKERVSRKNRQWRINNPEASRAKDTRRRARKIAAEGHHTGTDIKRQYKAQKGKCYYCGVKVGKDYHVDHVVPLSRGGSNGPENIVIACASCNQSKKDKLPHEWHGSNRLL